MRRLILTFALVAAAAAPAALADSTTTGLAPLPTDKFTREMAAHLLRRAGFGGTPTQVDKLHAKGLDGAVDFLVNYEKTPNPMPPFVPFVTEGPGRQAYVGKTEDERRKIRQEHRRRDYSQMHAARAWWVARMVQTKHPLEERMTLFWHNHFCSGHRDVRNSYHMFIQNTLLRRHATGNFGAFVKAVGRDLAMLEYLDNKVNKRQHPNENWARELMELFTLGVGNYTEKDIKEAARAFTGWTFRKNSFINIQTWHDYGVKTVLGKTGKWSGDQVIDIILEKPVTAKYISRKLFRYFAHGQPSEEVIDGLASTLRESKYELKPVLAKLFKSQAFYSQSAVGSKIKSPIDLVVGAMRQLGTDPSLTVVMVGIAGKLGQTVFEPPNVKGWPGGRDWITTSLLLERYNAAQMLVSSPRELAMLQRGLKRSLGRFRAAVKAMSDQGMDPDSMMGPKYSIDLKDSLKAFDVHAAISGCTTSDEIVDKLCDRFLANKPSAELRQQLVDYLKSSADPTNRERLHGLLKLIVSTPEFQLS